MSASTPSLTGLVDAPLAATLIAIVVAFRKEILAAMRWRPRFYLCVVISIVPAGLFGAFGKKYVEAAGESWWLLGAFYVFTAVLLTVAERISQRIAMTVPSSATVSKLT